MYWPIGAPKTYAASKHIVSTRSTRPVASDDGLDTEAVTKQDDEYPGDEQEEVISNGQPLPTSPSTTPSPSSHDIIDLKIARAGHIYASITESSLSVWQTKASKPMPQQGLHLLTFVLSLPPFLLQSSGPTVLSTHMAPTHQYHYVRTPTWSLWKPRMAS